MQKHTYKFINSVAISLAGFLSLFITVAYLYHNYFDIKTIVYFALFVCLFLTLNLVFYIISEKLFNFRKEMEVKERPGWFKCLAVLVIFFIFTISSLKFRTLFLHSDAAKRVSSLSQNTKIIAEFTNDITYQEAVKSIESMGLTSEKMFRSFEPTVFIYIPPDQYGSVRDDLLKESLIKSVSPNPTAHYIRDLAEIRFDPGLTKKEVFDILAKKGLDPDFYYSWSYFSVTVPAKNADYYLDKIRALPNIKAVRLED